MQQPATVAKALKQMAKLKGIKSLGDSPDILDDIDFDAIDECSYFATFKIY